MSVRRHDRDNDASVMVRCDQHPDPAACWQALEQLPPALRLELWEHPVDICSGCVAQHYQHLVKRLQRPAALRVALKDLQRQAAWECREYAAEYQQAFGHPLPAAAAGASLQRYGRAA